MHQHRDKELRQLRERVANAEYRVDPVAVADAVVRRRWRVAIAPDHAALALIASRRVSRARLTSVAAGGERTPRELLAA
jgi:hypothetical protein